MLERGWGRIINISSVNGQRGQFGQTNYSTAKAGIHGFTMALAQEVASKRVTVNTVSPGYVGTDMVRAVKPERLAKIVATIPSSGSASVRRSPQSSPGLHPMSPPMPPVQTSL
jgi:acetoacetyl-CoA reductase